MKEFMVVMLVLIVIVGFAIGMTFNVRTGHSITISLENDTQKQLLIEGRAPDTTFVSLQDTPYGDNIKILRVKSHHVWGGENRVSDELSKWLDTIQVTSYTRFPITHLER